MTVDVASPSILTDTDLEAVEAQIFEQSKRIEFYIAEYTVEYLADKMRNGDFVIPGYQRNFTWEHNRRSRFIESMVMGLAIPFLFFWQMPDGRLEIVDGSQRLRTIEEYIHGRLQLGKLKKLSLMSGLRFTDLPESRQRKIKNRSIRGIILNEHADDEARFDMFERINTGSKQATKAEVRRGALPGPYNDLIIQLAELREFNDLAPVTEPQRLKRDREDLVARFFAYGDGLTGYRDRPAEFLWAHAERMNLEMRARPDLVIEYRQRFMSMLDFVSRVFPYGFRQTPTATTTKHARFEAIAIGTYLALKEDSSLTEKEAEQFHVQEWLTSNDFKEVASSGGSNTIAKVRERIGFVRDKLLEQA